MNRQTISQRRALAKFDVELPLPPTMNTAYVNVPGKGRVKASGYSSWQTAAVAMIRVAIPIAKRIAGPIAVSILLPQKLNGDVDNRIKGVLDALVQSGRIDDDRNVIKVSAEKALLRADTAFVSVSEHGEAA